MKRNTTIAVLALVLIGTSVSFGADDTFPLPEIRSIESMLRSGDYRAARRKSESVTDEVADGLGAGDRAAYTLAALCTFRALAEAGLGNEQDAIWLWRTATSIFPAIDEINLEPFGAPGAFLRSHPFRARPGKPEPTLVIGDVVRPEARRRKKPRYPLGLWLREVGETVGVQVIVETDGTVSEPLLLRPIAHPSMVYALYEALREWRFRPATLDGEPVPVYFNVLVEFAH
jgi:protein TonB